MVKMCSACGLSIPNGARFCSWCGATNEVLVAAAPVAAPPIATIAVTPTVTPFKRVMASTVAVPTAPIVSVAAAPAVNMPAAPAIAVAPTIRTIPAMKPIAVPTVAMLDQTQLRLRFCNRCGVSIPLGEAKTYMGLVTCDDCFEKEPIPASVLATPTLTIPSLAYAMPA